MPERFSASVVLGVFVAPALIFAALYFPATTCLSRSLASSYPKADVRKRIYAAIVDGSLVATSVWALFGLGSIAFGTVGVLYLLLRDAVGGQSLGKFCLGLTVVRIDTGRPAGLRASLERNLLFLLPGANLAALFLEALTIVRDVQGQRLGDRLARTQVVEGLGARDLVAALHQWWRAVLRELPPGRDASPDRTPVRTR